MKIKTPPDRDKDLQGKMMMNATADLTAPVATSPFRAALVRAGRRFMISREISALNQVMSHLSGEPYEAMQERVKILRRDLAAIA